MAQKIQLPGGPDKTVTWIWLDPASGQLKIEFYDFSELAQQMFGNDIAYTLSIAGDELRKLYLLAKQDEHSLIDWALKTFRSYFEIRHWLDENGI